MQTKFLSKIALLGLIIIVISCKKEEKVQEQENLNVLKIKIGATTFTWSDTDGIGGAAPKIDTIKLTPNTTFDVELTVQDGSKSPVFDATPEIIAEKNDHLFVYKSTGNVTISNYSKDSNGKDFGQTAKLQTAVTSNGSLQILLKHLPDKSATDPSKTGETDLEVLFPVVVK
jgi:hypothetical protein